MFLCENELKANISTTIYSKMMAEVHFCQQIDMCFYNLAIARYINM